MLGVYNRNPELNWETQLPHIYKFYKEFEKWKIVRNKLKILAIIEKKGQLWDKKINERLSPQSILLPSDNLGKVAQV
jgi:hypothetical protein